MREPFHLRIHEIADLTDEQILAIYFRADPRDPKAQEQQKRTQSQSYWETFRNVWARRGKSDEWIKQRWLEKFPPKPKKENRRGKHR